MANFSISRKRRQTRRLKKGGNMEEKHELISWIHALPLESLDKKLAYIQWAQSQRINLKQKLGRTEGLKIARQIKSQYTKAMK